MLFNDTDPSSAKSLRMAFLWAAPSLAAQTSRASLFESLAQVLHWEGLDVFVLKPTPNEGLCLEMARARPERASEFEMHLKANPGELRNRLRAKPEVLPGHWDDASAPTPTTCAWFAAPLRVGGDVEAHLLVEGAELPPAVIQVIERFALLAASALERIREHQELQQHLAACRQLQRTVVAEERLSVLGEAAAVLAHEMRNPLGAISNAVSYLRRVIPDADAEALDIIRDETERLNALTRDLLQLARPLVPQRRLLDLALLTKATIQRVQGTVARKDVRFRLDTVAGPPPIPADGSLLSLALENLLRNAAQASPERGEVRVILSCDASHACITVEDEGPGILPVHRARIFEPFFTTKAVGTGLGLPIVKRVIEAHGGQVRVDDGRSGGTRFELLLSRA